MQYWLAQGAPTQKLNLGLAAYGRAFNLSSASSNVGAPANGPGEEGCYTGEEGFWASYEVELQVVMLFSLYQKPNYRIATFSIFGETKICLCLHIRSKCHVVMTLLFRLAFTLKRLQST